MATSDLGVVKPVLKGTHDQTKSYEVMNIVHANGKSYMANKDVPSGTLITEQEFWLDLSGNVMTKQELDELSATAPSQTNKIYTAAEVGPIQTEVTQVKGIVTTLQSDVATKISDSNYATETKGGTIKLKVVGTDCFITTDGSNP